MVQFGVRWIVAPRAGAHAGLLLYVLPKHLDEKVAALHLEQIGAKLTKLTKLTKEQANNHYRY